MDSKEDKISAGMTPVSILYEKLGKTGRRPIFELIYDSTSRPTCINNFTFRVKVGDIEQYGTATTKKAAKQAAAKAMLMAMSEDEDIKMLKKLQEHKNEKEDTFVNHVGNLMTFCSRNKLPKPFYDEDIDDDRPSHDMQFYCKCIVGKRDEIGASNTKRGAKHSAAQAMYARLIKEIEHPNDPYVPDYKLNNDDQFVKGEKYDPWPDNDAPWTNDDYDSYDTRSRQVSPNPSDINDEDYEERKTKLRLLELPNFEALGVPISPHGSETSASEREAITSEYGDSVIDPEDTKEKKTKLKLLDLGDRDIVNLPQTSEYNQTLTDNQQPNDYEQVQETKPKIRIANFGSNFENANLNAQTPVDSDPSRLVSVKAESLNEAERQYFTENNGAPVDSAEVEEEQEERKTKLRLLELDNFDIAGNNLQSPAYISNETNIEQPQNAAAFNIEENYKDYDLEADVKPIIKTEVKKKQNLNSSLQSTRLSAVNSGVIISLIPDIKSSHHFLGSLSDSEEEEAQLSTLITSQGQKYWPAAMDDYADKDSMQQTKHIDNLKNRTQETCATGKYFKDDGDDEKMNCCNTMMVYDNDKEKSENNVKYETKFHSMEPSKYFAFPKMRCLTRISETVSGYERVEYEFGDERVLATVRRLTEAFLLEEPTITAIKEDEDSDTNNNCISKINDKLYGTMMYEMIMNYGKTGDKLAIKTDSIAPVNKRISGGRFHDNKPNIGKTARRGAAEEKHNDATDSGYRRRSKKIRNEGEIKQENAAANQNSSERSISGAMERKKEHNNDDNKSNNQDKSQDSRDKGSNKKNYDKRKNSKENNSSNNEQKMEEKNSNAVLRSGSMKKENLYCPFEIDLVSESEEDIVDSNGTDIEESSDEWQVEEEFRHPRLNCPIRTEVLKLPFEIETINIDDGVEMDATSMTSSQEEALLRDDDDLGNVSEVIVDKRFAGINMNPRIVLTRCDEKVRIKSPRFIDLSKSPINNHDIDQKVGGIKEGTTFSDRVIDISIKEEIQELMDMVAEDEARKSVSSLESKSVPPVQLNEQSGADLQHEAPKVDEMKLPRKKARIFKVNSPKLEVRELLEEPRPDTRIFNVDSGEKEVTELLEKAQKEAQTLKLDSQTLKATELPEKPVGEATVFKIDSKVSNVEVSQAGATALDAGAPNAEQVQRPRGLARVFKVDSIDDKQLRRKLPGIFRARCGALQPTIIPEVDIKKEISDESELSSEKSKAPTASKPQEMDIKTEIPEDNRDVPTVAKPVQRTVRIIHKSELFQKRRRRLTRVSSNCPMSKNMETLAANAGPNKVSQNPGADAAIVVKKEIPFDEGADTLSNVNLGAVPMNFNVTLPPPAHAHIPRSDTTETVVEPMEIPEALDLSVSKPKESLKTPDEALTEKGMTEINPEILLAAENLRKRTRRRRIINQPSIPLAPVEKPQIPFVNSGQKRISEYFEFMLSHGVDLRKSAIKRICKLVDHMARLDVANDPRIIEGAIASMNEILETLDINFYRFCVVTHDGHYVSVIHVDSISEIVEVTKHPNVHEAHKSTFFKALKKVNQLLL